jgi:hypothetical protein
MRKGKIFLNLILSIVIMRLSPYSEVSVLVGFEVRPAQSTRIAKAAKVAIKPTIRNSSVFMFI